MSQRHCQRCDFSGDDQDDLADHARESGHPLCICCYWSLHADERQTCTGCLNRARGDLNTIVELFALLPGELTERGGISFEPIPTGARETVIPGGAAMVLLAGGNHRAGAHDMQWSSNADPEPPLPLLATWEDDWRETLGMPAAAGKASMASVTDFLGRQLWWAASQHPAFDDFARDLHRCRRGLEAVLRADERPLTAPAPCVKCGGDLLQVYAPPKPCRHSQRPHPETGEPMERWQERLHIWEREHAACNQGGLALATDPRVPVWRCSYCRTEYTEAQYLLAVAASANAS